MAYIPESNSVVAFQSNPSALQVLATITNPVSAIGVTITGNPSISGTVQVGNFPTNPSVSGQVGASVIGHAPVVIVGGSVAVSVTPVANQSVSGTVQAQLLSSNASVITVGSPVANQSVSGAVSISNLPITQNVSGSVVSFQGTSPWIGITAGSVAVAIVSGSIAVTVTPPANQSVSGAVSISNFPLTQNVSGSVIATGNVGAGVVDSGNPVKVGGKFNASTVTLLDLQRGDLQLDANGNQKIVGTVTVTALQGHSVSGTVGTTQAGTWISSVVNTVPSSMLVGASIIGLTPVNISNTNVNVSGSVVAFVSGLQGSSISGTVLVNNGSVVAFQGTVPWVIQSIVGTYAEDSAHTTADKGLFIMGVRNDTVASFAGANGEYNPFGHDSAGRVLGKPFAPEEARIEGYNSVVSTSVTTLVAAAGTGLKNYITDIVLANTGATTTLVTFRSGGGTSILGYGIAPAGGGSNMIGFATPMRTLANETFDFQATASSSILFAKVSGYKAP